MEDANVIMRRATPPWVRKLPARMKNGIAMISNFSMPVKSFSATDWIGTLVMKNRYVSTVRPSEIEIGIPVSISPNSSAKMIQAFATSTPASLSSTGIAISAGGINAGHRAWPGTGEAGSAVLTGPPRVALWALRCRQGPRSRTGTARRRSRVSPPDRSRMEIGCGEAPACGLADPLDVGDVVVRQRARARERPRYLQEAEAHQVRAEGNAQVDDPLRQLEVGRSRVRMSDVPDEARAERADDAGEQRAGGETEQHVELARIGRQTIDHHVHSDMDAGAHAVGSAELRHPHEHVDAQLLRPRQVDPEQPVLHHRNPDASRIAVHYRDEDEKRRGAHQDRDQPFLEPVENLQAPPCAPVIGPRERRRARSRLEARLLVHLGQRVLADARLVLLVHRRQRFLHLRLLVGRQGDDLRFPALAHRLERIVVLLLGDVVGELRRVLHGAFERRADIGRQAVPELLVDDHRVFDDAMLGEREILLHLVHLLSVEIRWRIFRAVDHPGLQRLIDLGERHHLRDRAEGLDLVAEHLRGLDAHLEALVVRGDLERPVGAEVLEAVVPVGEPGDALALELLEQVPADRAVGDLVQLFEAVEDVRQIEHLELAHAERPELGDGWREHLHRSELEGFHLLAVLEQRAVRIHLDLHPALGALFGELLEILRSLSLRRIDGDDVAELDDDRLLRERRGAERKQSRRGERDGEAKLHDSSKDGKQLFWFAANLAPGSRELSMIGRPRVASTWTLHAMS